MVSGYTRYRRPARGTAGAPCAIVKIITRDFPSVNFIWLEKAQEIAPLAKKEEPATGRFLFPSNTLPQNRSTRSISAAVVTTTARVEATSVATRARR